MRSTQSRGSPDLVRQVRSHGRDRQEHSLSAQVGLFVYVEAIGDVTSLNVTRGPLPNCAARARASGDHKPCQLPLPNHGYGWRTIARQRPIPLRLIGEALVGRSPRRPRP